MAKSSSSLIKSKLVQVGIYLSFFLVFVSGIFRYVLDPKDQTRCQSMLNDGWWQDPPSFTKWQPAGCMMHTYRPTEIADCLEHARVLYVGDSIVRQQFFALAQTIHPDVDMTGAKHVDRRYQFKEYNLVLEFWWDPFLNSSRTIDMLKTTASSTADEQPQPSMLVIGSGLWYMRYRGEDEYREEWQDAVDRVLDAVQRSSKVADAVVLTPVEMPSFDLLSPERERTMTMDRVQSMNDYLRRREQSIRSLTPITIPYVLNKISEGAFNMTEDGLHFESPVTTMQAQIVLNYRCNEQLPKHFPMDTTCCYHYPVPHWYQNLFFALFLVWVPIGIFVISSERPMIRWLRHYFPSEPALNALFAFGLGVIYMYFGDRTQMFGKAQKLYDPTVFAVLMVCMLVAGVITLKAKKEGDHGFLNRDQTDEWKGWMQVIILIYHFCGASSVSGIYNPVRVLVASYLFQTGYGHFYFFYKKADFSLGRVLNVIVRLNLLTFVLQYVMDTDYLSYYFTPLVSFWFLVIWMTLYVGHASNKSSWRWILGKIGVAATTTTIVIHVRGVLEKIFELLYWMFRIQWNAQEWRFRLALDGWIVYVGMLCAYATIQFSEHRLSEHPQWPTVKRASVIASVVAMALYFSFELSLSSKFVYNRFHPFVSWVPILAFVIIRNATVRLRNMSSKFFIFFGRISLETFIGQFHMWLAGDTKGLLLVITHPRAAYGLGWWLNLILSSVLFVHVCYYLSQSTGEITKHVCAVLNPHQQPSSAYQAVPLLPTTTTTTATTTTTTASTAAATATVAAAATSPAGHSSSQLTPASETTPVRWEEDECSLQQPSQPSLLRRSVLLWRDGRVRTALFLFVIGIMNRFC
ncbi:10 TM acyl transferase domain found in Cas1p-domain-containing protein [Dichotomocladium elegans]|nr:10 TM acyl transferase domain found in Cas1p-domain-containing protein [Dichotomocladium elegans]